MVLIHLDSNAICPCDTDTNPAFTRVRSKHIIRQIKYFTYLNSIQILQKSTCKTYEQSTYDKFGSRHKKKGDKFGWVP